LAPRRASSDRPGQTFCKMTPVRLANTNAVRGSSSWLAAVPRKLPNRLEGQIEPVDVALADEPAVGVAGKFAFGPEVPIGHELLRFAELAKTQGFELHEKIGENAS